MQQQQQQQQQQAAAAAAPTQNPPTSTHSTPHRVSVTASVYSYDETEYQFYKNHSSRAPYDHSVSNRFPAVNYWRVLFRHFRDMFLRGWYRITQFEPKSGLLYFVA